MSSLPDIPGVTLGRQQAVPEPHDTCYTFCSMILKIRVSSMHALIQQKGCRTLIWSAELLHSQPASCAFAVYLYCTQATLTCLHQYSATSGMAGKYSGSVAMLLGATLQRTSKLSVTSSLGQLHSRLHRLEQERQAMDSARMEQYAQAVALAQLRRSMPGIHPDKVSDLETLQVNLLQSCIAVKSWAFRLFSSYKADQ